MAQSVASPSRRRFIKTVAGCTIAVNIIPVNLLLAQEVDSLNAALTGDWSKDPGQARYRIDGVDKVTGKKIYARDFHSRDFPNWPNVEQPVLVIRATNVDENFIGLDLSLIPIASRPNTVIYGDAGS